MLEKTVEIEIPLLTPEIYDDQDECLSWLETTLRERKGIHKAHLKREHTPVMLCIHYDPNLISLASVRRTAEKAGSVFANRYRHEKIPFTGMDNADSALYVSQILEGLPGMLHARANYAANLAFVAYDSTRLRRAQIESTMRGLGIHPLPDLLAPNKEEKGGKDRGRPILVPAWIQGHWTTILVGLAGVFFFIGWAGETFFELPMRNAVVFYLMSYLTGGYHVATHAIPGLLKGKFNTDVLMLAAALGAAVLGEWAEGAFLLFLFGLGHAGEHYALDRARNAVNALGKLMPKTAWLKQGGLITEVPIEQLQIGAVVTVRPGDRVPVDGQVVRGQSMVDQSPITGESSPVVKEPSDTVFAGTINQDSSLEIEVTRLAKDNTLARVMEMVAEAQSQRSPTQQFTARFTARFVPAVLVLALLVIFIPPILGWMTWQASFYRAMLLLVAASPCALALGTPAAVLAGIAQAARNGVLIKGGMHLENLGALNVMAFDKTGTLTYGKFRVTDLVPLNGANEEDLLRLAAAVERESNHPLAEAVVHAAREKGLTLPAASRLENISGRGVKSEIDGHRVLIGSLKLFRGADGHQIDGDLDRLVDRLEGEGKTTMAVSQDGKFLGVLGLADTPKPGVKDTLQKLLDLGVHKLVMLTGDNKTVAARIGAEVGVTDVRADLLPEQKLAAIRKLHQDLGDIAMIGDGVNDAPALATATVGIAMGGAGTAVALETADVALMADDLSKLPFAVGLSRASRAIIRQNFAIALGVIVLLILTSVLGVVQLSGAVVLHEGSTILVVLNALRLLRYSTS